MSRPQTVIAGLFALALLSATAGAQASLSSDLSFVSLGPGGTQTLFVDAGPANAGASYAIVGSVSGVTPGFAIGGFTVPLNQDAWFDFTVTLIGPPFTGRFGVLDAAGRATASFTLPPVVAPQLEGLVLHHAFAVVDAQGNLVAVSNAESVRLTEDLFEITAPRNGSVVGSPRIDVRGEVAPALAAQPGLSVTVDGIPAVLSVDSRGITTFARDDLLVAPGARSFTIVATAGALSDTQTVSITHSPRPSNNIVIDGDFAYLARGSAGFSAMALATREVFDFLPAPGSGSVDDLAVADGFLFVLDAASPGRLSVYDLAAPAQPVRVSGPVSVPVGPFAGVSAGGGRVVVSGGTSLMTVREYGPTGALGGAVASIDLGIGQPDVLVSADGSRAFVSTDFAGFVGGSSFGITRVTLRTPPLAPLSAGLIGLPGSGFTAGTRSPANFPIASAELSPAFILTAHGGGLSLIGAASGGLVGTASLPFAANHVATAGDSVFVVGGNQVRELDYTNPQSPIVVATMAAFTGGGSLTGVAANDAYVAFAANTGGTIVRAR